jgi:hypothetical protein
MGQLGIDDASFCIVRLQLRVDSHRLHHLFTVVWNSAMAVAEDTVESAVVTLTAANFDELVRVPGGKWLVELYVVFESDSSHVLISHFIFL